MKSFRLILTTLVLTALGSIDGYRVGLGRADITGPSVEIGFMGYAQLKQKGQGIHTRLFARTFIVEDEQKKRVVFVSADSGMATHFVKRDVLRELNKKYGDIYQTDNVMISGTHTHSGPGGFHKYVLYDLTALGFCSETYNALVRGITQSIINAHNSITDVRIFISETVINDANINRSPAAYENNPDGEKAQFTDNVDKNLLQLRFMDNKNERVLGVFNWFAVHPTSMNNTNKLISSDNVGYASLLMEQEFNYDQLTGKGNFVGAFCSANLGDVSPNIMGPKCQKTGEACDILTSSCPDDDACFASGPGRDMFESTKIIGQRIYKGASKLLSSRSGREVKGDISFIHQFIDMPKQSIQYFDLKDRTLKNVTGCSAAMGYSFAAGTTDGPGAFDFKQGTVSDNPFWNLVRDVVAVPSQEDIKCHGKKPILLPTGRAHFPYDWQPHIVPLQVFTLGDVMMFGLPGELTTMAGRRLRAEVQRVTKERGVQVQTILCGLSNSYSSYVTTPEEYDIQRYEGASTIFGPYTLPIYINKFLELLTAMISNQAVPPGPTPDDQDEEQISLITKVIYDYHPLFSDFGYVLEQPRQLYSRGETVTCCFVSGNPRNNLMTDRSYFYVEQLNDDGTWTTIANDASWDTKFIWKRVSTIFGTSDIQFYWTIPDSVKLGRFRVRHLGYYRNFVGQVFPYQGSTNHFDVN